MASSVKQFCTICHDDGISNSAVTWCTECEIFFCEPCQKPHSKSRLSKNHKTMSAENYQKIPTFIREISSQCKDHRKKFELYCSYHACPCCVQCTTDKHQKCHDMKPLSDILKQVKSSASVQLLETDLKDVKENLDTAIKYLKTRISTINTQKKKAIEEIQKTRKSIADYLNKLEQTILDDLEFKHSKLKLSMTTLVEQMEQRASKMKQIQSEFTEMTKHATELQMYIGLREIEKTTSQTAKYIEDLESGDSFYEKNLEVKISSALRSILKDVKSFGDVKMNTASSTLQIKTGRNYQAQHLVPKGPGIDHIKLSFSKTLIIPEDMRTLEINATLILPNGKFVILDSNKSQLLMFSNEGIFIREIVTFTDGPNGACFVSQNTVAVTLGNRKQTTLVDIEKNAIIERIEFPHECEGVASDGKTLVISEDGGQITTVNLNDKSQTILEVIGTDCISLFQGKIYCAVYLESKVYCYKITGEPLWTFQHQYIAKPAGITLDMNGFVYIVSNENESIVVVSPDGKTCKKILSEADGIDDPWAIDINRETGMMIVSSEISNDSGASGATYETAFVYEI
ncbi:uncharacterized protein LOC134710127 [Mytilus trossulus]|uniref:uncharacterized protein LOC134710127 n=1 Tax=Mytilus trossulus TaxID=6551 RepID=UPI003006EED1